MGKKQLTLAFGDQNEHQKVTCGYKNIDTGICGKIRNDINLMIPGTICCL